MLIFERWPICARSTRTFSDRGIAAAPCRALAAWRRWSLARQFAFCASIVLGPAMAATGHWIARVIEDGVLRSSSAATALYMESFVEPLLQELARGEPLSLQSRRRLETLLQDTSLGEQVVSLKIWVDGGRIEFASRAELIGRTFEIGPKLREAWRGRVAGALNKLRKSESAGESALGMPLTEVYVPIRARGTDRIIAVAEFYGKADLLMAELAAARRQAWLRVTAVTLAMLAGLFLIVRQGSATIATQQVALATRIDDLTRLLAENAELRQRAEQASQRASESNEFFLRRLGADLHDGPAQLVSLALLKLSDSPAPAQGGADARTVLAKALTELRQMAAGLIIPEVQQMTLDAVLREAAARHVALSGRRVDVNLSGLPAMVPQSLRICAYRVVQEGLINGLKHADGIGQSVSAGLEDASIVIEVADSGSVETPASPLRASGLGMRALQDRVESLGGEISWLSEPGRGTRLIARLPLDFGGPERG